MQWILWFQVIERELPYGRGWTGELKFYDVALKLQLNGHCKWYICQHFVCLEQWFLKSDNGDISLRLNKSLAFFLAGKTEKKKGMHVRHLDIWTCLSTMLCGILYIFLSYKKCVLRKKNLQPNFHMKYQDAQFEMNQRNNLATIC